MTHVIILAGGKGKRLNSEADGPKVLRKVGGKPIILRILESIRPICPDPTIIIGFEGQKVIAATGDRYRYVWQADQLGTGHAVLQTKPYLMNEPFTSIVVLPGDSALVTAQTVNRLVRAYEGSDSAIALATVRTPNFQGPYRIFEQYGRVVRSSAGDVLRIVEFKDASPEERKITEVNCSYYCFDPAWLWEHIELLDNKNASHEFYLTDLIGIAVAEGAKIHAVPLRRADEGIGVNTPEELVAADARARRQRKPSEN